MFIRGKSVVQVFASPNDLSGLILSECRFSLNILINLFCLSIYSISYENMNRLTDLFRYLCIHAVYSNELLAFLSIHLIDR